MIENLKVRPASSVPLVDADVRLNNFNWTKGLQAESDWIWSGNLNPQAFPNNLARYFLQIPGVFEQQLNYSTTLIFDEPSYRNGVQMSGFVPRVTRELVISLIAQLRRCRYSLTHHAILGTLTARKHGLSDAQIEEKWSNLSRCTQHSTSYTRVELAALVFAQAFATDPKAYRDEEYSELRVALAEYNVHNYGDGAGWLARTKAAREAYALALSTGLGDQAARLAATEAGGRIAELSLDENERRINAQVVELAFLSLQFVALTDVFSSLNIPDEDFLRAVFDQIVPQGVRNVIDGILNGTTADMPRLCPPRIELPVPEIKSGQVAVEPSLRRGTRIPLISWELEPAQGTRDKGLAIGGIHIGVYGWSFGAYFPGSLTYALMHHGELARYEAPYSLPLLFNEDEWRNGTQTAGFNRPVIKETLIQKVYHCLRSRYGLEHHTMFFFNAVLKHYGVGDFRVAGMTDEQHDKALAVAIDRAEAMVLNLDNHREAPTGIFTPLMIALIDWVEAILLTPHSAYRFEVALRHELDSNNLHEISSSLRRLDKLDTEKEEDARKRLVDHQIAELAMIASHMDGLGRFLTILQLESELPVSNLTLTPGSAGVVETRTTGAMNNRPGLFDALRYCHVTPKVLTYNELLANPVLNEFVRNRLGCDPVARVNVASGTALRSAEF